MWRLHKNLFVKEHFLRKTREELKEARVLYQQAETTSRLDPKLNNPNMKLAHL
jgi:hypothetical protein